MGHLNRKFILVLGWIFFLGFKRDKVVGFDGNYEIGLKLKTTVTSGISLAVAIDSDRRR